MIVGIVGKIGSGKTLFMTFLMKKYKEYDSQKKIYSNYKTKISDIITFDVIKKYAEDNNPLKNCVLGIDEIQTFLDCRNSLKNTISSYFILQTRKRNVFLLYTTQQFFNVDKRLRNNTDYLFSVKKITHRENKNKFIIRVEIIKNLGGDCLEETNRVFYLKNPEKYFNLYDTYEIIKF